MDRKYRIVNISGNKGVRRTAIPLGSGCSLVAGTPPGRRRRLPKRGRHVAIVSENTLRRLVGYYRRGQMSVSPLGGGRLPAWLEKDSTDAAQPEKPEEPSEQQNEEPEQVVEETPAPELDPEPEVEPEPEPPLMLDLEEASVSEMKQWAEEIDDVSILETCVAQEQAGKNRKTALKALEDRIEELKEG